MLRGTPEHPKTVALIRTLQLPKPHVVGLLELLWHFTATYAPEGDIGRWPDAAIEGACGWTGDPGALVAGLLACGWLDESEGHRLVVHDWHEHSDRYVRRRLARHGRSMVGQVAPKVRPRGGQRTAPPVPVPVPEPVPEPEHLPAPPAPAETPPVSPSWSQDACDAWIERFGGTAPGGQIGTALKPLVRKHGWPVVRVAWRTYLAQAPPEYASAARFGATYGDWARQASRPLPL